MKLKKHILFVAAENDGIIGCKAGGIGDVVRDAAQALGQKGYRVSIVTPAYGRLHLPVDKLADVEFPFEGHLQQGELYEIEGRVPTPNVRHYVLHSSYIKAGNLSGGIYNDDGPTDPFYTDAIKYAAFCTAVNQLILEDYFKQIDCLHLHDWHATFALVLKEYHPQFAALKAIRTVFTIHNIEYQGIRPFNYGNSSLQKWFPNLNYDEAKLVDPNYKDCFNLMAIGIRLADAIQVVSPSYAQEVLLPSKRPEFIGGEGLEKDLLIAKKEGKLYGILNGADYEKINTRIDQTELQNTLLLETFNWIQKSKNLPQSAFHAKQCAKLVKQFKQKPSIVLTSVSRLVDQKFYCWKNDQTSLKKILDILEEKNGLYILLGSGLEVYENLFKQISEQYKCFVFLNGYSEKAANALYAGGNLFMMPSSFEPCGISQLLSMRDGQPCLVHSIGGLKDTVRHKKTGFQFDGKTMIEKDLNMVKVFEEALTIFFKKPKTWNKISKSAAKERFLWEDAVEQYLTKLYQIN